MDHTAGACLSSNGLLAHSSETLITTSQRDSLHIRRVLVCRQTDKYLSSRGVWNYRNLSGQTHGSRYLNAPSRLGEMSATLPCSRALLEQLVFIEEDKLRSIGAQVGLTGSIRGTIQGKQGAEGRIRAVITSSRSLHSHRRCPSGNICVEKHSLSLHSPRPRKATKPKAYAVRLQTSMKHTAGR